MKTSANRKMKLNDQQLTLDASQVSDLYHKLTLELFDQVVDRLLERGSVSLAENPYIWQLEKMNQMGLLNEENVKLIADYSGIAEKQLRQVIEGEGYKVYKTTRDQLAETLGADDLSDDSEIQNNLAGYANQALSDVHNLINTTLPESARSVFQSVIEESVGKVVTGIATPERALNDTIMKWFDKGFYGFTDSQGKRWKADSYARTIIRSTVKRAFREMRTAPAKEFGIDTFYFSKKATAREACAPLQHQIVTYGPQREEDGITILSMADHGYGTPAGCLGINCGHDITPFVVGFNELPDLGPDVKDISPSEAIANANAQAKQRALERSIRDSKERLHVANKLGDKDLISKYKSKIRTQQSAMRDFLKDKPFLHRDYAREKYYANPYAKASKQLEKAIESGKIVNVNSSTVGHTPPGRIGIPNTIVQHDSVNGEVLARAYYDGRGLKSKEVHFTNHGRPDKHPYGLKGEHVHDYTFDDKGKFVSRNTRELTKNEREENLDILWRY